MLAEQSLEKHKGPFLSAVVSNLGLVNPFAFVTIETA